METIELLAQTVNILNELLIENDLSITDDDNHRWLDMVIARLEQEGYSVIPFTSIWAKDT